MIGRELNHYTVLSKLGEGGMAQVYRARDNRLDRDVALKVLPDEMADDARRIKRFEREAKVVAALNHPNIVTIYSVEECDGVHFLTMELVDGKSLDEIIPPQGLELGAFYRIALPLLDAVAAAHRRGIVHRDIKPANVMVNSEGVVKLLDLGLAKLDAAWAEVDAAQAVETWTRKGRAIGTVPYMAPEQLSGAPIDHRVDIFALGVVLYEMLTCRRPFVGATSAEVISAILDARAVPVKEVKVDLPDTLARIIEHCLERDPGRRYQSVRELREALARAADPERRDAAHSSGRETIRAHRPITSITRRRQWLLAAGIALAAMSIVATAFLWRRGAQQGEDSASSRAEAVFSLAVSPLSFDNRGPTATFARQLEREVVGRLAQIDGLDLVASSGTGASIPPEADYLLWGAVNWLEPDGGEPRIRASFGLLRTLDGRDIWTESFDRSADAIDLARREIALLVESRVGRLLGFPVPEVANLGTLGRSESPPQAAASPPQRTDRRASPARSSAATVAPAAATSPAVAPPQKLPESSAAAVSLTLELRSEVAHGSLTVYADDRQILREGFHFTAPKEGVLGRLGVRRAAGGDATYALLVPAGTEELRIYVSVGQEAARQASIPRQGLVQDSRLVVSVADDGEIGTELASVP